MNINDRTLFYLLMNNKYPKNRTSINALSFNKYNFIHTKDYKVLEIPSTLTEKSDLECNKKYKVNNAV